MNRRHFFFGTMAFLPGCQRVSARPAPKVSVLSAPSYSGELEKPIRDALVEHQVKVSGKRILLKPNLVEFSSSAPVNTNPIFVAAVAAAFASLGASKVHIAEGPGHRRTTFDLASAAGYFTAIRAFEQNFTDLNLDQVSRFKLRQPFSTLDELYLPQTVFDYDLLVSLPKMKTHHWTGATLSMKNLFGVVPGAVYGWPKNVLHWAGIDECIADLHFLLPQHFCLVDGIEGMEGNGPILGTPVHSGVIVAGSDPPSVDATCCRLMQIDPAKVRYLNLVAQRTGLSIHSSDQIGESVSSLQKPYQLLPELAHMRLSATSDKHFLV